MTSPVIVLETRVSICQTVFFQLALYSIIWSSLLKMWFLVSNPELVFFHFFFFQIFSNKSRKVSDQNVWFSCLFLYYHCLWKHTKKEIFVLIRYIKFLSSQFCFIFINPLSCLSRNTGIMLQALFNCTLSISHLLCPLKYWLTLRFLKPPTAKLVPFSHERVCHFLPSCWYFKSQYS